MFSSDVVCTRQVLAERYITFRLEVQTANDKGERASYAELARRVTRREDRTAAAAMPQPRSRPAGAAPAAGAALLASVHGSPCRTPRMFGRGRSESMSAGPLETLSGAV